MSALTYPASDLDRRENLLALLGSHWQNVYHSSDQVGSYRYATAQLAAQAHLELLEAVAALSVDTVPVFHRDNLRLLTLRESELNSDTIQFGDASLYFDGRYKYGSARQRPTYRFPVPTDLQSAPIVSNRITQPSVVLTAGVDCRLEPGQYLELNFNPFEHDSFPVRPIIEAGVQVDRETALWLTQSLADWQHIQEHFGFLLGLSLESCEASQQLLAAVFDAFASGGTAVSLAYALSAITGAPVVRNAVETVELVQADRQHLVVVTDKSVYLAQLNDSAAVTVGDVVRQGDFLTTAVRIDELNTGSVPAGLSGLVLEDGMLAAGYVGGVTFQNETVDVVVETVADKTRVSWPLGGFPTDVDAFWDQVHDRGVAAGKTLAQLLDVREFPVGEPTSASLPATVNPLEWLLDNVLRFNSWLVRINTSALPTAVVRNATRALRKIVPPWTAMLVLYEFLVQEGEVALTGDDVQLTVAEDLATFSGTTLSETVDLTSIAAEAVKIYQINGACQ